jgi:hypothetical protein
MLNFELLHYRSWLYIVFEVFVQVSVAFVYEYVALVAFSFLLRTPAWRKDKHFIVNACVWCIVCCWDCFHEKLWLDFAVCLVWPRACPPPPPPPTGYYLEGEVAVMVGFTVFRIIESHFPRVLGYLGHTQRYCFIFYVIVVRVQIHETLLRIRIFHCEPPVFTSCAFSVFPL